MQLFCTDATIFSKNLKFFCPQKVEKTTLKSCSEKLKSTFFPLLPWAAQKAQKEEFMFQNVAYRPTVYRTGICSLWTRICPQWFISKLSLSKQDEVFNSKKSNFFFVKSQGVWNTALYSTFCNSDRWSWVSASGGKSHEA